MTTFDRVKNLAAKKGISLTKLAEVIDISSHSLYKWKTSTPSADKLEKVADYFNVSVDYLLGRTESPEIKIDKDIETIAAHVADKERKLSKEELENIKDYIDYIISKNDKK